MSMKPSKVEKEEKKSICVVYHCEMTKKCNENFSNLSDKVALVGKLRRTFSREIRQASESAEIVRSPSFENLLQSN